MKAFLMHPDRDLDVQQELPVNEMQLTQDLELTTLFQAMSQGDGFLFDIVKRAVFTSLTKPDAILYRQEMLKDSLENPSVIREIYQIPIEAEKIRRRHLLGNLSRLPSGILSSSIEMLQTLVGLLKQLKQIAGEHGSRFQASGFTRFFEMVQKELDESYISSVEAHLLDLKFHEGAVISAVLGKANLGTDYVLRKSEDKNWTKKPLFSSRSSPVYSFTVNPHDELGVKALADIKERAVLSVANLLAQAVDHIESFFNLLRVELAFYVGCINLHEQLARLGKPVSFPLPAGAHQRRLSFRGLYDVSLALTLDSSVVGNDLDADQKDLFLITGANQGGKSTFLRSIGQAQLLMQCGMFVPAESFSANLCAGLFTHYRRKEDSSMKSGKLDEELSRMSQIIECIRPDSLLLFNESFASTNEREGSDIAREIVCALLEKGIKIFFVTHLYEFARSYSSQDLDYVLFLMAERKADGGRTYKIIPGEPLPTSHGRDLYQKIFRG